MSIQQIPRSIGTTVGTGLASAGIAVIGGHTGVVEIFGMNVPEVVAQGLVAGAASGVTEFSKNWIIPMITNDPFSSTAVYLVQPAVTGLALVGFTYMLGGVNSMGDAMGPFINGAMSQVIGSYGGNAIDNFIGGFYGFKANRAPVLY